MTLIDWGELSIDFPLGADPAAAAAVAADAAVSSTGGGGMASIAAGNTLIHDAVLGAGSFGIVLKAQWRPRLPNGSSGPASAVALKVVSKQEFAIEAYDKVCVIDYLLLV